MELSALSCQLSAGEGVDILFRVKRRKGFTLLEIGIVIGIVFVCFVAIILPSVQRGWGQRQLAACSGNLESISRALTLYSRDYYNQYPPTLNGLVANGYLSALPNCPASSLSYIYTRDDATGMNYTVYCPGSSHRAPLGVDNYPQYTSQEGLLVPSMRK